MKCGLKEFKLIIYMAGVCYYVSFPFPYLWPDRLTLVLTKTCNFITSDMNLPGSWHYEGVCVHPDLSTLQKEKND